MQYKIFVKICFISFCQLLQIYFFANHCYKQNFLNFLKFCNMFFLLNNI